ncbi:senescence-induced receptor-like serine/threonine-protein kinase [Chenopodium quinoa]|uniref:senescence-induced receptor-like serine/threonine-protein kinase n=1 Tax=Chenopodium quinoa TaxID=63459 RepID=UPI000B7764F9|nr:senescence-induced receptor-like serine/threonine-protein kinase [Chenopodium quinoa]
MHDLNNQNHASSQQPQPQPQQQPHPQQPQEPSRVKHRQPPYLWKYGLNIEYSDSISWRKRVEIAIDTAQGLDYLHHGCSPPKVHRDVKPANILLNKEFRAKVHEKGDVYSFGVVLLELITEKTAIVNRVMNLGKWVRSVLERGDIASILEQNLKQSTRINDNYLTVWKAVELAVRCIQLEIADRPTMTQIVTELKGV